MNNFSRKVYTSLQKISSEIKYREYCSNIKTNASSLTKTATFPQPGTCYHRIDKDKELPDSTSLNKNDAIWFYTKMNLIRRMETTHAKLYTDKLIRGFCHLYSGQEACAVGVHSVLRPDDCVITAYRCHGWTLMSGTSIDEILAEMCGRDTGCSAGRGGSMHMYGKNFFGGNGIVGAHVPVGTGIGLALKLNNKKAISVVAYGDGAANQGQTAEAFNMAKLWNLPILFLCENNEYGMGTKVERASANVNLYQRGDLIPGIRIDGMDVLAVRDATKYAIDHCDSGKGPILVEAITYRYFGHSMSDPGTSYRTREEVQSIRENQDPIKIFEHKMISSGLCTDGELKDINNKNKSLVETAVKKAKSSKEPLPSTIGYNVYKDSIISKIRNNTPDNELMHKIVPRK